MTRSNITIKFKGPLLTGKGSGIVKDEAGKAVQELVELGEEHLNELGRRRPAGVFLTAAQAGGEKRASQGNWRRFLSSEVFGLRGVINDGKILYGPWLEGTSSRNRTTRFKGYAMFRRTLQWLEGQRGRVADKMLRRIVRRLGG